jgi:universal stress protein A
MSPPCLPSCLTEGKCCVTELKKILVAVNFEENEREAADWAATLGRLSGGEVKAVYVVAPPEVGGGDPAALAAARETSMAAEVARLSALGASVQGEVVADAGHGASGTLLRCAESWGCDMIVLGSHPRTGLAKIFDSSAVAQPIIEGATCAVLLVKSLSKAGA